MLFPVIDSLLYVFNTVLGIYEFVVILAILVTWLIPAGVISMRNDVVRSIVNALDALTDPVLRRIRRVIPPIGGVDLSAIALLIALEVIKRLVNGYAPLLYTV